MLCKSSYYIIKLILSIKVYYLNNNNYTLKQEYKTRGSQKDKKMLKR